MLSNHKPSVLSSRLAGNFYSQKIENPCVFFYQLGLTAKFLTSTLIMRHKSICDWLIRVVVNGRHVLSHFSDDRHIFKVSTG